MCHWVRSLRRWCAIERLSEEETLQTIEADGTPAPVADRQRGLREGEVIEVKLL